MLSASDSPRTRSVTDRAWLDKHLYAFQRGGTDRFGDLGGHRGEGVEHLDRHLQHAGGLDGSVRTARTDAYAISRRRREVPGTG
jgi:hypothetical protein